ncbi:MAG TPA: PIN domain-containing protein [Thermoanaerobaculia bacterium]|nr:PIN domain-containing protein [Thermoanaerobaculia bacterium]
MTVRAFVDTNVFGYLFQADEPEKQAVAREVAGSDQVTRELVVSTQVLQEFYVTVTRKLAEPLSPEEAAAATRKLGEYTVARIDPAMVYRAIDLSQRHTVSFWDALILRAAIESGCEVLLTEDLHDGWEVEGVRVENPFRSR